MSERLQLFYCVDCHTYVVKPDVPRLCRIVGQGKRRVT
jgi:hypothetical protein